MKNCLFVLGALALLLPIATRADATADHFAALTAAARAANEQAVPAVPGKFSADWTSLGQYQCPAWFRDAKFGIWAHWGPQCQPEQGDWYARNLYSPTNRSGKPEHDYTWQIAHYGHPSQAGFKEVIHEWRAQNWDPEKLVRLYRRAGAQYFMAMGNHHDNFDNWDSTYQPWNAVNLGPRQDLLAGWSKAARDNGLHFGVSIHAARSWSWYEVAQKSDPAGPLAGVPYDGKLTAADGPGKWWNGLDPQDLYAQNHPVGAKPSEAYGRKFYNRIMDMVTKYQPDLIYFDDSGLPLGNWGLRFTANFYNLNLQWHHGDEQAVVNAKNLSPTQRQCLVMDIERGKSADILPQPWQTDTCTGQWHYNRGIYEHHNYKKAAQIIPLLIDVVSKNGNLMLNIPVRADGTIDDDEIAVLNDLAAWTAVNGPAVYATRPWKIYGEGPSTVNLGPKGNFGGLKDVDNQPYTGQDLRFTVTPDGQTLYAFLLGWPADGQVVIPSLADGSPLEPREIAEVKLLGAPQAPAYVRDHTGLHVTLPATQPCATAWALAVKFR